MRKIVAIIILSFFAALPAKALYSADQDLIVSGKTKLLNDHPRIAMDPDGNILVVWDQNHPKKNDFGHIYAAYLTRNADGSYTQGPVEKISEGTGPNHRPDAIYLPEAKAFFIVWDTGPNQLYRVVPDEGVELLVDKPTNILGRPFDPAKVATAGSCLGDLRTVAYGVDRLILRPMLAHIPGSVKKPDPYKTRFGLVFNERKIEDSTSPSCFDSPTDLIWLDIEYYLECTGTRIKDSETMAKLAGYADQLFWTALGIYVIAAELFGEYVADMVTDIYIFGALTAFFQSIENGDVSESVDGLAKGITKLAIGQRKGPFSTGFTTAIPLTDKKFAAISNVNDQNNGSVCAFSNKLTKMKDRGCPAKGKTAVITHATLAKLGGDFANSSPGPAKASDVWAVYRLENGNICARNLKTNGKATGDEKTLFTAKDNFVRMYAKGFGKELLVTWVDQVKKKKSVIKLKVHTINPNH